MKDVSLKDLLEAGCHFGHQTNRWQPKAADFIYGEREGVHVIDLAKTRDGLLAAAEFLKNLAKNGGTVVFVGTKRQAQQILLENIKKVGEGQNFYYLVDRWPGGFLTNFVTIKKNNLDAIVKTKEDIANNNFVTKKEKLLAQRKLDKYVKVYGGLVGLEKIPDAVFLVDIKKDNLPVREAVRANVDIVAIVDTNTNPEPVKYQIPANDDAVGSVKIIMDYLTDAWIEGRQEWSQSIKSENLEKKPEPESPIVEKPLKKPKATKKKPQK